MVLGQPDMTSGSANNGGFPSATTIYCPSGVSVTGTKLYVADYGNNRVLIWTSLPTPTQQAADIVLGQANILQQCELCIYSMEQSERYKLNLLTEGSVHLLARCLSSYDRKELTLDL